MLLKRLARMPEDILRRLFEKQAPFQLRRHSFAGDASKGNNKWYRRGRAADDIIISVSFHLLPGNGASYRPASGARK